MVEEMSKYFTLKEMISSSKAKEKNIDNTPTFDIVDNLKSLCEFLDGIREYWGNPIKVTSGYRCSKLNKAVGGSTTSAHMYGFAADIQPQNMKQFESFKKAVKEYLKDKDFDQCIIEKNGKSEWIHLGLYNKNKEQRKKIFKIEM